MNNNAQATLSPSFLMFKSGGDFSLEISSSTGVPSRTTVRTNLQDDGPLMGSFRIKMVVYCEWGTNDVLLSGGTSGACAQPHSPS